MKKTKNYFLNVCIPNCCYQLLLSTCLYPFLLFSHTFSAVFFLPISSYASLIFSLLLVFILYYYFLYSVRLVLPFAIFRIPLYSSCILFSLLVFSMLCRLSLPLFYFTLFCFLEFPCGHFVLNPLSIKCM